MKMTKKTPKDLQIFPDINNKIFVNNVTTAEGPSTQDFTDCVENSDNKDDGLLFVYPTITTEVVNTVGNWENDEAIESDVVCPQVLEISLPLVVFYLN